MILLAVLCLLAIVLRDNRAAVSLPVDQTFMGEYSQNGGPWTAFNEDTVLSTDDGDVTLKGHFLYDITQGGELWFYRDHIGVSIFVNGKTVAVLAQMEEDTPMQSSMCGREWYGVIMPAVGAGDVVEIHLHSVHNRECREAFTEFLQTLCLASSEVLQKSLIQYSWPTEVVALILIAMALILIGAAAAALVQSLPDWRPLWRLGVMSLFAGLYSLLDMVDYSLWSNSMTLATHGRQLCVMLFALSLFLMLSDALTGRRKKIAEATAFLLGAADGISIFLAVLDVKMLADTRYEWKLCYLVLAAVMLGCCIAELPRTTRDKRRNPAAGILLLTAGFLDMAGVARSIYSHATCTKAVYITLAVVYLAAMLKDVVVDNHAAYRARQLEAELEQSRIDVMLSQIQPHFIFNTLTAIYQLCEEDPPRAREAVGAFSRYIRRNLEALKRREQAPFEEELKHIEIYLWLEQLRFGKRLQVRYQIECMAFLLPVLTVQPLVENAVKHGISKRREGGTVIIAAQETPADYRVTVSDDGVGFDTSAPAADEKNHVGLKNIRSRLWSVCGGTLSIESTPGQGTAAVITIPKQRGKRA